MKRLMFALSLVGLLGLPLTAVRAQEGAATIGNADQVAAGTNGPSAPGQALDGAAALKLADTLGAKVYLPLQHAQSLRCEFTPKFFELGNDNNPALAAQAAPGMRLIFFDGNLFYPLQDEGLTRAARGVFYWQKSAPGTLAAPAAVELFDAAGAPIALQPFVSQRLGLALMHMQLLDVEYPLLLPAPPYQQWRMEWRLDASNAADQVLSCLFQRTLSGAGDQPALRTDVHFDPQQTPLSAGLMAWDAAKRDWKAVGDSYPFKRLGTSPWVGISNTGMESEATWYEWAPAGNGWAVAKADGFRPAFERGSGDQFSRWQLPFSKFALDAPVPPERLVLPVANKVKFDFSSPAAAMQTVVNCILADRQDLLPWCTVGAPQRPVPSRGAGSYLGYLLEVNPALRDRVKIAGQQADGPATIFTLRLPKLWQKQDADQPIRVVPVEGGQYRVQGSLARIESALYQ